MRQRLEGITRQQQQWQRRSSRRCSYGRWNEPRPALFCCSRQSLPIARPAQITNYRVVSGAGHCRASSRPAPWSEEHRYQPPPCKGAATSLHLSVLYSSSTGSNTPRTGRNQRHASIARCTTLAHSDAYVITHPVLIYALIIIEGYAYEWPWCTWFRCRSIAIDRLHRYQSTR